MLRKGLTSKLFFLAFLIPATGYVLAQRIQEPKKTPNTSKTSIALKKLEKAGYLRRENDGRYHHIPEKLAQELFDYLENERGGILDQNEKKFLKNLISENYMFVFPSHEIFHRGIIERPKRTHDLDAIKTIAEKIGEICAVYLESKRKYASSNKSKNNQSFEKIQEELSKQVEVANQAMEEFMKLRQYKQAEKKIEKKTGKSITRKEKMRSYDLLNNTMKSMLMTGVLFEKIPDTTLEKFAELWDQYYGFQVGVNLENFNPIKFMNSYS